MDIQLKLRNTYHGMIHRCYNPKRKSYYRYGGRGIKVCSKWLDSFDAFVKDMGDPPGKHFSIDRIDNDGDYCPENCRWATPKEQRRNASHNHWVEFNGKRMMLREWAAETGLSEKCLGIRLNELGWSVEQALTTPNQRENRIEYNGQNLTIPEWVKITGIPERTIYKRWEEGKPPEQILTHPRTRPKRYFSFNGESHTLREWSEITGIPYSTLRSRLYQNMPIEKMLTQPHRNQK